MGNFNIMGSYSGIDMSVIDRMIEAEKSKGVQFTNRKEKIEREQGAWKDVGTRLTSLGQKSDALTRSGTFKSRTVSTNATGNPAVSVTAGNSAPVGSYRIDVKKLATSSRFVGDKIKVNGTDIKDLDQKLGFNSPFKFINGDGEAFEIKVNANDSLRNITKNINAQTKKSGIEASVIDNRLILKDTMMGDREIRVENTEAAGKLGFTGTATTVGSRMTGDKIDQDSVRDLSGSLQVKNQAGGSFKLDVAKSDSLEDIVNKINGYTDKNGKEVGLVNDDEEGKVATNTGIKASIVDGSLVLTDTSKKEGDNELSVTDTADEANKELLKGLGFTEKTITNEIKSFTIPETNPEGEASTTYSSRGQGAVFSIDGVEIERDTNRITDAIEGVAFTLENAGASEVVTITNNVQKGVDAVKEFVDQYNSVMNFIQTQTDVGTPSEDNNTTGALVGEGSIMRLQSNLRSMLGGEIKGGNKINIASKIGIQVDRYGVASLDEAKLNEALQEDPENVARFFYQPEAATLESGEPSTTQEKGMSELFKNLVESYTSTTKGIISTKNKSYERMVKEINQQIETFNDRIDKKRDRYIKQFAALDEAMMRAESQMDYLYSQMNIE